MRCPVPGPRREKRGARNKDKRGSQLGRAPSAQYGKSTSGEKRTPIRGTTESRERLDRRPLGELAGLIDARDNFKLHEFC